MVLIFGWMKAGLIRDSCNPSIHLASEIVADYGLDRVWAEAYTGAQLVEKFGGQPLPNTL